jgi:murein L,D-transpeptidase YafK
MTVETLKPIGLAVLLALGSVPAICGAGEIWLPEKAVFPPGDSISAVTLDRPLSDIWRDGDGDDLSLVVHKSRRRLDLMVRGRIVKSYLVNLGLSPRGDKEKRGDTRTPEGDLFVCAKNARSQFTRFLALAYPSPSHLAKVAKVTPVSTALQRGVQAAYARRDRCPPQLTALGGAVGIHGSGAWTRGSKGFGVTDWTWGCIGLRDTDILELFSVVQVGTPVRILAD